MGIILKKDRRRYTRVSAEFPVVYRIKSWNFLGRAINVSKEGMMVESYLPLETALRVLQPLTKNRGYKLDVRFTYKNKSYRPEGEIKHFHLDFFGHERYLNKTIAEARREVSEEASEGVSKEARGEVEMAAAPIGWARDHIYESVKRELLEFHNTEIGKKVLITGLADIGKTHNTALAISRFLYQDGIPKADHHRVLYVAQSFESVDDEHTKLKDRLRLTPIQGKERVCQKAVQLKKYGKSRMFRDICKDCDKAKECPYIRQFYTKGNWFITQMRFLADRKFTIEDFDIVIFDEFPDLYQPTEYTIGDIVAILPKDCSDLENAFTKLLSAVKNRKPEGQGEADKTYMEKGSELKAEWRALFDGAASLLTILRPMLERKYMPERLLLEAVLSFDEGTDECGIVVGPDNKPKLHIGGKAILEAWVSLGNKLVFALDGHKELASIVNFDKVVCIENVKRKLKTYRVTDKSWGVFNLMGSKKDRDLAFQLTKGIIDRDPNKKTFIVGKEVVIDLLKRYLAKNLDRGIGDIIFHHYGAVRNLNRFSDCERVICVGSYNLPPYLSDILPEPAIYIKTQGELAQAIYRTRPNETKQGNEADGPKEVQAWILTNQEVKSFGIDKSVEDAKTAEEWLEELCGITSPRLQEKKDREVKKQRARELANEGYTQATIATKLRVGKSTVGDWLRE